MNPPEYVTIVYRVESWEEFKKDNPLHFRHHGLKAVTCACYDAIEKADELEAKQEVTP